MTVLLDSLGSPSRLAELIGVSYAALASWKHRGSVPERWWRALSRAAQELGHADVTYEAVCAAADRRADVCDPGR